jgi:ketosteroid isomerase-like protein
MVRNRFGREGAPALIWARRSPYSARSPPERDTERAVSQENVELVRSLYQAGDPSRFFDLLSEDVELDFSAYPVPDSNVLRGKDAAMDWSRRWWGTWDEYVLEPTEIIDAGGDRVVVVQYERGRGKGSAVQLERRWAVVYTIRMGKVVRFQPFKTRDEALEAARLSE